MGDGAKRTTGGITSLRFDETVSPIPHGLIFEGKILESGSVVFAGLKNAITSITLFADPSPPALGRLSVTAMCMSSQCDDESLPMPRIGNMTLGKIVETPVHDSFFVVTSRALWPRSG